MLRMRQDIVEFSVIGHDKETFRMIIETAYREYSFPDVPEVIHDRPSSFRIRHRSNDAVRLVKEEPALLLRLYSLAKRLDPVRERIGFRPEFFDNFAVDAHLAGNDQLFCLAAGANTGAC